MYLLILISLIILSFILSIILNKISPIGLLLESLLTSNDLYIFSNNFCCCGEKNLFFGFTYFHFCDLCRIRRVINFENEEEILNFLKELDPKNQKKIRIILHSRDGKSNYLDFLTYTLKKNKFEIETFIPEISLNPSSILVLASKKVFTNWYTCIGPITNTTDETKRYYLRSIVKKKLNKTSNLLYLDDNKSKIRNDKSTITYLGGNTEVNIPNYVSKIFQIFKSYPNINKRS